MVSLLCRDGRRERPDGRRRHPRAGGAAMILVAGGTGHLGIELVPLLTARGIPVRVVTRDPARARQRLGETPQLAKGDARNPRTLEEALKGVDAEVSAMTGFGPGAPGPKAVDYEGNLNLIRAAEAAGVRRFVLVSIHGATADHAMELWRMKYRAEEALRASRLDWVIVRPNAYMELWAEIVAGPIFKDGKATVFGRGDNAVNFNSAKDVASFVELALFDPDLSRTILSLGGPDHLTLNQLVGQADRAAGREAAVKHVHLRMMRLVPLERRPLKPVVAARLRGGLARETVDPPVDRRAMRRLLSPFR